MTRTIALMLLAVCATAPVGAQADAPPEAAFSACTHKTLAADCELSSLDRTLEGLCVIEGQDHLYCLPYELSLPPPGYLN